MDVARARQTSFRCSPSSARAETQSCEEQKKRRDSAWTHAPSHPSRGRLAWRPILLRGTSLGFSFSARFPDGARSPGQSRSGLWVFWVGGEPGRVRWVDRGAVLAEWQKQTDFSFIFQARGHHPCGSERVFFPLLPPPPRARASQSHSHEGLLLFYRGGKGFCLKSLFLNSSRA